MIKAIGEYVIVKQTEAKKTDGIFIIPETAQKAPKSGLILSIGEDALARRPYLKEGMFILYEEHGGKQIEIEKVPHLIMKEANIFAIDL